MVGTLPGTDATFLNPANQKSTHFGIGRRSAGGPVEISQYVDLSDSAWGNGNVDPATTWPLLKRNPDGTHINPNKYTISIEHEDGGSSNRGVVDPAFIEASVWLSRVLLTGSALLLRGLGIRVREDATLSALRDIDPGNETYIDHRRIAGSLKPDCWRPWLDDPGFVPYWKPIMLQRLKDTEMTIDEIIALLQAKIGEIEADRDTAIRERDKAKADLLVAQASASELNARLSQAKVLAGQIVAV
jgi:hypothetical protein